LTPRIPRRYPTAADDFKLQFIVMTSALDAAADHAVLVCGHTRPDNCMKTEAGARLGL